MSLRLDTKRTETDTEHSARHYVHIIQSLINYINQGYGRKMMIEGARDGVVLVLRLNRETGRREAAGSSSEISRIPQRLGLNKAGMTIYLFKFEFGSYSLLKEAGISIKSHHRR